MTLILVRHLQLTKKDSYSEAKIKSRIGQEHIFKVTSSHIDELSNMLVVFDDVTLISKEKNILTDAVDLVEWELLDAQKTFTASKERFECAINSSSDGFWDIDFRTNELYLSSSWKKRLGFTDDEKISYLDYTKLILTDDLPNQINTMIENVLYPVKDQNKESYHFTIEYKIKTKSDEIIIIEDRGELLFDENKDPYRIFGFHRDITKDIQERHDILQQAKLASLGQMIGNIAHQWRQPISAINGLVNDLEFEIKLDGLEEVKSSRILEVNNKITGFTHYLSKTIDDFRNFIKEDNKTEAFELHSNIEIALKIIEHSYTQEGIILLKEFNTQEIIINGYPRELNQVIINIFNNAKDAIVEKKIKFPSVTIKTKLNNDNIIISIRDNAGGIDKEIIDKIFNPYFTTKHESIGTGIGLSMSKNIIDNHFKGLLNVENNQEGAVFTIRLPMKYQ